MTSTPSLPTIPGLANHVVINQLGEGGMGKVFLARNNRSGEMVVVKTIHEHLRTDPKVRQRFQQEVDLMRGFQHPNAVALLQAAPPQAAFPFFVMEFIRGATLESMLQKQHRFNPLRAGCFLAPLCLFLQAAHEGGLLHRDLTPSNIMVTDPGTDNETIKVMDFGLARRIGFYIPAGQLKSGDGEIDGGTPDFVCPEQILGRQVDQRGDLFSVGVLMYGLLTGHLPFEHLNDPMEILDANLHQPPPPFRQWNIFDVPSPVERLVLSWMSKNPADRPANARVLVENYQEIVRHRFVTEQSFAASCDSAVSTLNDVQIFDPRSVVDKFDAMMIEQVAAMKLRGFVDGVGGQIADSDGGVIKVRQPRIIETRVTKTMWSWFKASVEVQVDWIPMELHMSKKKVGSRDLVEITVVRPLPPDETIEQTKVRKNYCDLLCRELRAYLMVGH